MKKKNAIILAAGFGMRMIPINLEQPKALIKVKNEILIERLLRQLHDAGIQDIKIVVGFQKEKFEYLKDEFNVDLITNKDFETTTSLHSLYLAKDSIQNTFILPSDVWLKENIFKNATTHSWYLVKQSATNFKNSPLKIAVGGTAYIAEKDAVHLQRQLEKMDSKDENDYWEQAFMKDNQFMLPVKEISSANAIEINTYEQLLAIDENSDHLKNDAIEIIKEILKVSAKEIKNISVLKKGMTNRSFKFCCKGKKYIMRIPGAGTDKLIDRKTEYETYQIIKPLDISEPILYMNPETGYKLTEFISNTRNSNAFDWNDVVKCMRLLKQFHQQHLTVKNTFNLYEQIEFYEHLRQRSSVYPDYVQTKTNVLKLRRYIETQDKEWTLCHIDANCDNFLINKDDENQMYLIDWEYAGMQDPHVDIAMFGIYAMYDKNDMDHLIEIYCPDITKQTRAKIYAYIATCGLLWSNWCEYKKELGNDFGEYALKQYQYAKDYYKYAMELIGDKNE